MYNSADHFLNPWEQKVDFMSSSIDRFRYGARRGQKQEEFISQFLNDIEWIVMLEMTVILLEGIPLPTISTDR